MNNIYVVYYWPDFEDSPEVICAVTSEADAQELVFFFLGERCIRQLSFWLSLGSNR